MIRPLFVVIDYRLKLIQFWLYRPLIRIARLSQWWLTSNIRPLWHRIRKSGVVWPSICLILWLSSCLISKLRCWVLHIARLVELIRLSSSCCWRHEGSIHVALNLGWCIIVFCNQSSFLLTWSPCLCGFPTFSRLAPKFTNFNFIGKRNCLSGEKFSLAWYYCLVWVLRLVLWTLSADLWGRFILVWWYSGNYLSGLWNLALYSLVKHS